MMTGRKIGTIAALGGSTAALAMLTGIAGARADDLRINQQLLDTRIDQLAATGQSAGTSRPFSVDENPAAGSPVTAGSFPRSILIPGSDTSIKIYGQITEVLDYFMSGGNPNVSPQSTTIGDNGQVPAIPLNGTTARSRSNGIFSQTAKESKIGFETRTPTPFGEARTVFEFDWAGATTFAPGGTDPTSVSDNIIPRLRYAYGTLGGLLAGQATSNFSDPDANAETLDFGGNVGEPGHVRIPQVRYTMPAWWGASFSVSAETPDTIIANPNGLEASDAGVVPILTTTCPSAPPANGSLGTPTSATCSTSLLTSGNTATNIAKSTAPDFTAAWYYPQPWGHFDVSAVLRPGIDVTDGRFFSHSYVGYGGHVGFDFKPGWMGWAKDDIAAHFTIGDTIGPYLNSNAAWHLWRRERTGDGGQRRTDPLQADAGDGCRDRLPALVARQSAQQHQRRLQRPLRHPDLAGERDRRAGRRRGGAVERRSGGVDQQEFDDRPRQHHLEPGVVCRYRPRICLGPAHGAEQPARDVERAGEQAGVPLLGLWSWRRPRPAVAAASTPIRGKRSPCRLFAPSEEAGIL
jgi:Porin subfamily